MKLDIEKFSKAIDREIVAFGNKRRESFSKRGEEVTLAAYQSYYHLGLIKGMEIAMELDEQEEKGL